MKLSLFIALIAVAFSCSSYAADLDSTIQNAKQTELEAEHDTLTIKDLEAERANAKEQTKLQEQISRDAQNRLEEVKSEKAFTTSKAKEELAQLEARRKAAEKSAKAYKDESAKLSAEIKKYEEATAKAKKATKDAEDIANAGKEEITVMRDRKQKLEAENREVMMAQNKADTQMLTMRQEYARLSAEIKELEARVQANQTDVKKKQAMIATGAQRLSAMQAQNNQLRSSLGLKPVAAPALANNAATQQLTGQQQVQAVAAPPAALQSRNAALRPSTGTAVAAVPARQVQSLKQEAIPAPAIAPDSEDNGLDLEQQ